MNSVTFEKSFLHMDVLCLRQYLAYTLAGIGNSLFVYKNAALVLTKPIFEGERVHSIATDNNLILIKGGRQLSIVGLETSPDVKCEIISQIQTSDWVQDVILLEKQLIGLVTAHNAFECWSLDSGTSLSTLPCKETCILYSCKMVGHQVEDVIVFSGTVFGNVMIWSPSLEDGSLLHRLEAHKGAVFSIEVKPDEKLMTTTSDDRSLKVWSIISSNLMKNPSDWRECEIQLTFSLFGHTARVWRSLILPDLYLSAGEDSQLIVWKKSGAMRKCFMLHQESGIRALDYCKETNMITTGGEDGGINMISLTHLMSEVEGKKVLDLGQSVSTKLGFTKNGFFYTASGTCILVTGIGEELLYWSDDLSLYCVVDVSPGGEYIAMGSLKGDVVVIDSVKKEVLAEERVVNGRVYSVHWLAGEFIAVCGPEGKVSLWELSNGSLEKVGAMLLPNNREMWTTCGEIHNGRLVLGDRSGGIHVYELRGDENPLRSYRKLHSYLGVTDIKSIGDVCLSVGRDGTVKEYTGDMVLSTTYKLQMEWPWKVVDYEDDVLVLGFLGSSFIVWSMKWREVIGRHDCGGGHRSCDYKIHKNRLSFLYVKEKKLFAAVVRLDGVTRMRNAFHGKEINCLKIVGKDPEVIVTGSEDTTVRISLINGSDIKQVLVLKTHVSSVRTLCTYHSQPGKVTIISAGGKGQIVVWDLNMSTLKCQEMVNHRLNKIVANWKIPALSIDPDTRVMCVDVCKSEDEVLITVGCSDCQIRIFSYNGELKQSCAIRHTHCVLKTTVLRVGSVWVLVSMGTDGKVLFRDITARPNVSLLGEFPLHQSGINSFQFEEIGAGEFLLATGGDDNLVSVAFVQIQGREVSLRQAWTNQTAHSCQVTGIKIIKDLLVTASIDQRITVWRWRWQGGEFTAEFLRQKMTAVADVQGMDATWEDGSSILVAVHGKGLETFRIAVGSADV